MRTTFERPVLMCALLTTLPVSAALAQSGDRNQGARLFVQQCAACHSVEPGRQLTGPSLAGLWNRKAGTAPGFSRYSTALSRADIAWNGMTLDHWLRDPGGLVPGNQMTFRGIADDGARHDVIAYLKAVSEGEAPRAARGARAALANLKEALAANQVRAISYCPDAYRVATSDGKTHVFWEFNLRFKTDSSADGPLTGKPVLMGAGMMGDRASVVFAAPDEISGFIRRECLK
ncbi:MAG: c-type cytochrome [Longimicrobiales bacterium]